MRPLQPRELLGLWEHGRFQHPVERALTLVESARPESSRQSLAELTLGARDYELLNLRKATFGDWLRGEGDCPECESRVEFEIEVNDLLVGMEPATPGKTEFEMGSYRVVFRALNSLDLLAISALQDVEEARLELVNRCVMAAFVEGEALRDELPSEVLQALARRVEFCDPLSDIVLHLECPDCEAGWNEDFDIASFLWAEVVASAEDILFDVDLLARAYGWPEGEVLGLSPARRAWYVEAVS